MAVIGGPGTGSGDVGDGGVTALAAGGDDVDGGMVLGAGLGDDELHPARRTTTINRRMAWRRSAPRIVQRSRDA
jgi:hypothetical protein